MNTVSIYLFNVQDNELPLSVIDHYFTEKELAFAQVKTSKRRAQYFASRFLLRYVLSIHCKKNISDIDLVEEKNSVPNSHCAQLLGLQYSISHSGENYCLAISKDLNNELQLGVDIELLAGFKKASRADFFCNAKQLATLESLHEEDKKHYLCELWTRKEAVIKSFGGEIFSDVFKQIDFQKCNESLGDKGCSIQTTFIDSFGDQPFCLSLCSSQPFLSRVCRVILQQNGEVGVVEADEDFMSYYLSDN